MSSFPFTHRTLAEVEETPMTEREQAIYDELVLAAQREERCPTNVHLAAAACVKKDTASKILTALQTAGHITITITQGNLRKIKINALGISTARTGKTPVPPGERVTRGCAGHHAAILALYGRMAEARGVGLQTAMWHAQHGREVVERTTS